MIQFQLFFLKEGMTKSVTFEKDKSYFCIWKGNSPRHVKYSSAQIQEQNRQIFVFFRINPNKQNRQIFVFFRTNPREKQTNICFPQNKFKSNPGNYLFSSAQIQKQNRQIFVFFSTNPRAKQANIFFQYKFKLA